MDGFSSLTFTSIMSIHSNMCEPYEHGLIQGALVGIEALARAIAPMVYKEVYSQVGER